MADCQQLENYKVQLAQVEAALSADKENEELLKLKKDLEEVIELTIELVGEEANTSSAEPVNEQKKPAAEKKRVLKWKVGDKCLAIWSQDGKYYKAVVQDILPESATVGVIFEEFQLADICLLDQLKLVTDDDSYKQIGPTKKELQIKQREYNKKKNQKKKERLREKDVKSEISKHKWQDFNKRVKHKSLKGRVKKSIFASPEGVDGRVGVGTCGTADKDMTKYSEIAKYNARHLMPK